MSDWTKIISFTYPHEAHLAKAKLESEGITVEMRDELTAQVNNFYSGAIGGVKLFVQQEEFDPAYKILVEAGYIKPEVPTDNKVLAWIDKFTARLPFIGKSMLEIRLITFIATLIVIIAVPIALLSIPTIFDRLTENRWCIEKMLYDGKEVIPKTTGFVITFDQCAEIMSFYNNGEVSFPGINSREQILRWDRKNDRIIIGDPDITRRYNENRYSIYHGIFKLEINNDQITMQSDSLTIIGSALKSNFHF